MRLWALALAVWLWATPSVGGTLVTAGNSLGSGTALRDVFQIWGDTQQLARDLEGYDAGGALTSFEALATWACAQRANPLDDGRSRVRGVLQMGDIVDNGSIAAQWTIFGQARDILESCATGPVPAVPTIGNHDTVPIIQCPGRLTDATNYQVNAGADQIDGQPWFGGRPLAQEVSFGLTGCLSDAEPDQPAGTVLYQEAPAYGNRSFWVNFTNRLRVFSADYEVGIRAMQPFSNSQGMADRTVGWITFQQLTRLVPEAPALWVFIGHAAPCYASGTGCTNPAEAEAWGWHELMDTTPDNAAVFLGGHWNASAPGEGHGQFTNTVTRDSGGQALAGIMDFSSTVPCDDITAGACLASNPYTWQGMLILDRTKNTICIRTARYIDIDSDNNGTVNVPAAGATSLAAAATTYNRTQPAGAPNDAETCITVPAL